ncbi:MAG: methyltransferase domain-containing protein [Ilumatobacter sp.]|nr:methyltransferase domain-containing protein [Ilumatobacter sp.]
MKASERWAEQLAEWAIPDEILAQADESPWSHDTATFAVDDNLDRSTLASAIARAELPPSGGSVLDVGCGGGRAALSLVPPAEFVIGVDESHAMLASFAGAADAAVVESLAIPGRWPDVAADTPRADVVTCHHVAYNVSVIVPFITALTDHARRAVVLVVPAQHPSTAWNGAWKHFWGLDRPTGPTASDFADVLTELHIDAVRWEMPRPQLSLHAAAPGTLVASAMRRLCLRADRRDEVTEYLERHEPAWVQMHDVFRWSGDAG